MDLHRQQPKRLQNTTTLAPNSNFSRIFSFPLQEHPLQPHKSQMQLQWMVPPETQNNKNIKCDLLWLQFSKNDLR